MGFCGSRPDALNVRKLSIYNECFIDLLILIPHAVFTIVSIAVLILRRKCLRFNSGTKSKYNRLSGHTLRWIVTHVLVVAVTFEITEGILSATINIPNSVTLHTFIPHLVSIIASVLTIIYYHNAEKWRTLQLLLPLPLYWFACLVLKVIKGVLLYQNGLRMHHAVVWLTWITVALYLGFLFIELYVIIAERHAAFKSPKPVEPLTREKIVFSHDYVSFLSRYTFWWINDILIKGYRRPLELKDLGNIPDSDVAKTQNKILTDSFEKEKKNAVKNKKSVSFWRSTFRAYWPMILFSGLIKLMGELLNFVGPWCIEHIITYAYLQTKTVDGFHEKYGQKYDVNSSITEYGSSYPSNVSLEINKAEPPQIDEQFHISVLEFVYNGYVLSLILVIATLLKSVLLNYHYFLVTRESVRYRTALQSMIYDKALRLSGLVISGGKMTVGEIVNHMSTDTNFLLQACPFFHDVWASPLMIVIAMVLMYYKLGISAIIGASVIVLAAPLQYLIGKGMSRMQKKIMVHLDSRVKKVNETIQGIKVIKLMAWEPLFAREINKARAKEIKYVFLSTVFRICFSVSYTTAPVIGTMIAFVIYPHLESQELDVSKAIATLTLFGILFMPTALFTHFCTSAILARVSARRILRYFLAEESENACSINQNNQADNTKAMTTNDNENENGDVEMELLAEYRNGVQSSPQGRNDNVKAVNSDDEISKPRSDEEKTGKNTTCGESKMLIEVNGGNFSWEFGNETNELALKNINIQIPKGKLTIIVGSVGAGKSSLISAILGEMLTITGNVTVLKGTSIAYCTQKAWLQNTTLKDNILFGETFSEERYRSVIQAAALEQDLEALPAGDQTEIGEKGINLSGGQKQRISVARALYSRADTIVMDDPFSALDAHVGKHVFEAGVLGKLIKRKKSVILVTHQLQYLNFADKIIVMKDGCVQYQGKFADVRNIDPELYESWKKALKEAKASVSTSHTEPDHHSDKIKVDNKQTNETNASKSLPRQISEQSCHSSVFGRQISRFSTKSENSIEEQEHDGLLKETSNELEKEGQLIDKEHRETGAVSTSVYFRYVKACGFIFCFMVLVCMVFYQFMWAWATIVISIWSEAATDFTRSLVEHRDSGFGNNTTIAMTFDNDYYKDFYVMINTLGIVGAVLSGVALYTTTIRASKYLHRHMLDTVLHLPLRFFDTNPTGRILNRFSADMSLIDQKLPNSIEHVLRCTLRALSAVIVNVIGTPFFLIAAVPLSVFYYFLQKFFRTTAREIKRLDSITKSPIYSFFSESLNGIQTIRAYTAHKRFREEAFARINENACTFQNIMALYQWLGVRMDAMGSIVVFLSALGSLTACLAGQTSAAYVGISMNQALIAAIYFNWIIRSIVEAELAMNSVERVIEYTRLEKEETYHPKGKMTIEENWPEEGKIEFHNVSLRYDKHLQSVVKGITFQIHGGEKVGICGRTGSGKSSLTLSIFRMIDICDGEIAIDGKDTARVPLPQLRSKIDIIPQDPVLFTGSIRYNLDPSGDLNDDQLWSALETVQLKDTIEILPNQLDSQVTEGGENFSVGQKQLFCLARAFLRNNKILILDEATASIDLETDNKLQRVIATAFKNKTVITIAHRISTILKYDRVMVLQEGQVIEFDKPETLMKNKDTLFHSLVSSSKK